MQHRSYPRIHGSVPASAGRSNWVATEKVHGANLVIATNGRDVRIGKRKAWLRDDEAFFGWQLLRTSLAAAAIAVWRSQGADRVVSLHGELYGGSYPHPAVPPIPGNQPVQTGIWYAPDVRFSLFDVQRDTDAGAVFLAHRAVEALAAAHEIEAVPLLGRGSRQQLEDLPVRFVTHVPALHGLPGIVGNVAEGWVLKPEAEMAVESRPAVKRKIAEFDDLRFDDGAAWDPHVHLSLDALLARAGAVMNVARIASARSKVGIASKVLLVDEAVLDSLIDLEATFPRAMSSLDEAGWDAVRAEVLRLAQSLISE